MWEHESRSIDRGGRVWPRLDLRAGDEDRRQVVAELQRHYVEGRLSAEELGDRVSQAQNARTFGDLATVLSDLPSGPVENSPRRGVWSSSVFGMPFAGVLGIVVIV